MWGRRSQLPVGSGPALTCQSQTANDLQVGTEPTRVLSLRLHVKLARRPVHMPRRPAGNRLVISSRLELYDEQYLLLSTSMRVE